MQPVMDEVDKLKGASSDLKRIAKTPLGPVDQSFADLQVGQAAAVYFREQIDNYSARCKGAVLTKYHGLLQCSSLPETHKLA
jgi:hypothetical protein